MRALLAALRRHFGRRRLSILAAVVLVGLGGGAIFADCLASDLPILLRYRGELYILPNITRPGKLRAHDNQTLQRSFRSGDWALFPLIEYGPQQTQPGGELSILAQPGGKHWLGTDDVGRDVLAQLIHGARTAFLVGIFAVLLYLFIGLCLGAAAGYYGGWVDSLVGWGVAVMLTFPTFLLVIGIQGLAGNRSLAGVILIIGLTGWAGVARLVRGEVLRLKSAPFVEAARAAGASPVRVLGTHILPHALAPVLVAATFGMGSAILIESALSFLGLAPDTASWGRLIAVANESRGAWWLIVFPGLAIFATVLAYNLVAEDIQEALDPRAAGRLPPV